jgi:hypothetical protein
LSSPHLMHLCAATPMHFLSAVDTEVLGACS